MRWLAAQRQRRQDAVSRRWMWSGPLLVVAVASLGVLPSAAVGSPFRQLASTVTAFASDGTRYVAWEAPGEKHIFILDTRTGHRSLVSSPCGLVDKAPAAAGRFLLECGLQEEALLDARTGITRMLPAAPPHSAPGYGPIWTGVGSRYVIGEGGDSERCRKHRRHEGCLALYDIATSAISEVAESDLPDPDRPGARAVCRALQSRVSKVIRAQTLEGLGPLSPLQSDFGYSDGLLAEPEGLDRNEFAEPVRHLLIVPCHGRTMLVPAHAERGNLEPYGWDLQFAGGLLTWDTGHLIGSYNQEEESGTRGADLRHGILGSYDLHVHRSEIWRLPVLALHGTRELVSPSKVVVKGTFGYSAHTDQDVFWIAARSFSCVFGEGGCAPEHEVFAIYAARL
jgi:hypothetical protein